MMEYCPATKQTIAKNFEASKNPQGWTRGKQAYFPCNKCGWNVECVEDCIITTSSYAFWNSPSNRYSSSEYPLMPSDFTAGIYHTWCRKLCPECSKAVTSPHDKCEKIINDRIMEKKALEADELMVKSLTI